MQGRQYTLLEDAQASGSVDTSMPPPCLMRLQSSMVLDVHTSSTILLPDELCCLLHVLSHLLYHARITSSEITAV